MAPETPSPPASDGPDPLVGTVLRSRYRILAPLGQGGMGVTYRAWDIETGRPVVLKHPKQEMLGRPGFVERFSREARMMAALGHPHVVPVSTIGEHDGIPYLVMPFLPGGSLSNRRPRDESGRPHPVPASTLHLWLPQVAAALDYVHSQGVVHRDVKPGNVFFDAFWHAYLGDFGIAKVVADTTSLDREQTLTATNMAIGTQEYMAPEMFAPKALVDGQVDQYALGVMVYEMLAGRRPFTGDTAHVIVEVTTRQVPPLSAGRRDLPPSLEQAVYRALAKRPNERFASCQEFAQAALADVPNAERESGVARLLCPECGNLLKLPISAAGQQGKCPRCREQMTVASDLSAMWLLREEADKSSPNSVTPPMAGESAEQSVSEWDVFAPTAGQPMLRPQSEKGIWAGMTPTVRGLALAAAAFTVLFTEAVFVYQTSTSSLRRRAIASEQALRKAKQQLEELEKANRKLETANMLVAGELESIESNSAPSVTASSRKPAGKSDGRPVSASIPSAWKNVVAHWKEHAYAAVITEQPISKSTAEYWCRHGGGRLVNIETVEELVFLKSFLRTHCSDSASFHTGGFRRTGPEDEAWIWSNGEPAESVVYAPASNFTNDDWNREGSELRVSADGLNGWRARWAEGFVCEYDDPNTAPPPTVTQDAAASQLPAVEMIRERHGDPSTTGSSGRGNTPAASVQKGESALAVSATAAPVETETARRKAVSVPDMRHILSGRDKDRRQMLVDAGGGSDDTEAAVNASLDWIVRNVSKRDALWSLTGPYTDGGAQENRLAASAMALIALQGAGNTPAAGKHQAVVARAWKSLLRKQQENGSFDVGDVSAQHSLYSHAQATIALCEAFGMTKDPILADPATQAVAYAIASQGPNGGWRYGPGQVGDMSVTGWHMMALKSAQMAGLDVPPAVFERLGRFLDTVADDRGLRYGYMRHSPAKPAGPVTSAVSAEGLLCRQHLGWMPDDQRLVRGVGLLLAENQLVFVGQTDAYAWYHITQVAHNMQGEQWKRWNDSLREALPAAQVRNGRERGSWDPTLDRWGHAGGRLFVTCLYTLMLEVYYRHLPLYANPQESNALGPRVEESPQ